MVATQGSTRSYEKLKVKSPHRQKTPSNRGERSLTSQPTRNAGARAFLPFKSHVSTRGRGRMIMENPVAAFQICQIYMDKDWRVSSRCAFATQKSIPKRI